MRDGDRIEIIDSTTRRFEAVIGEPARCVQAQLDRMIEEQTESRLRLTVAQALPKGQKMDFVIEKLTELGAAAIIPMRTERTIVSGAALQKVDRWRRLAKTAAAQCGRQSIPRIEDVRDFSEVLSTFDAYDRVLLPWELAQHQPLRTQLPQLLENAGTVLVLIGPEGGFSHAEAESARAAGAQLISLGRRILRTETAALVALAIIGYILDDG
jgi:16S rRNA (uracil1498-N3)-methyltransferase